MSDLSDDQLAIARAIDLLTTVSPANFENNRKLWERRKAGEDIYFTSSRVTIPWSAYFELVDAIEVAYPGAIKQVMDD